MEGPNNNGQIPMQQPGAPQMQMISAAEWAVKFPSKRESYHFLAMDCESYLPPYGKYLSAGLIIYLLI